MTRSTLTLAALGLTLVLAPAAVSVAEDDDLQAGRPLATSMTGAQEAPGPGDPDGSGQATITLNHGQGQVCWELTVENIGTATAAHIHKADAGDPGPVVVPLSAPAEGSSKGCADVARELIKDILQDPDDYYVNVHNAEYPNGAIRGQLGK
jgi:hypothetical protein